KLTAARLDVGHCQLSFSWARILYEGGRGLGTYSQFLGLIIKHHRVQMRPVQVRAMFWVTESFSAGRAKSEMPAITSAHFMTGAQKCTVLRPIGLFHMRLTHGSLASEPAAVL